MHTLDKSIEKKCPPSDKRLNTIAFVGSIVALACICAYFIISGITIVFLEIIPFSIFAYGVFFIEVVLLAMGFIICIGQLIRNRYHRIVVSLTMYLITLGLFLLYIIAVGVRYGIVLIPFLYHAPV